MYAKFLITYAIYDHTLQMMDSIELKKIVLGRLITLYMPFILVASNHHGYPRAFEKHPGAY